MARDAVVLLEYFGTLSLQVAHGRQVRSLSALGVDVAAIEDKDDTQGAEHRSIIDDEFSTNPVNTGATVYGNRIGTGFQYF